MIRFISTSVRLSLFIHTSQFTVTHALWDCPSSPVVSWQQISTQKPALQITMKSCYFVFSHSVLLCPNLYSTTPNFYCAPPAYDWLQTILAVPYKPSTRTYRKHVTWSLSTVVWCHCLRGSLFTEPLPRNGLHNPAVLLLQTRIAGCLSSRCLAMRWHVTILSRDKGGYRRSLDS
jgi:hypothetical protein